MSEIAATWEQERARRTEPPERIAIFVHLRDTETGDAGVLEMPYDARHLDNLPYMFTDGNYGCDCNRSNFLAQAIDGAYDTDLDCNWGPIRVAIDRIVDANGELLYRD